MPALLVITTKLHTWLVPVYYAFWLVVMDDLSRLLLGSDSSS